ncbi:MAG: hypothetical protein ABI883_01650, partial [Chthoniobacterales bacterium]
AILLHRCCGVKTTIDIPEELYRRAKIRAVELGSSLKALVLTALEEELGKDQAGKSRPRLPYFERRKLLPGYEALLQAGAFREGTDSAEIVSQERDAG